MISLSVLDDRGTDGESRAKTIKNKVSVNVQRTAEELEIIVKALQEELKKWKDIAQGRASLPPRSSFLPFPFPLCDLRSRRSTDPLDHLLMSLSL